MASRGSHIAVSLLFTVFGGPGIALVLVPYWLTRFYIPADEPAAQCALAVALIVLGLIPGVESVCRFVVVGRGTLIPVLPTERLVVSGFYRFVRNPMYAGVLVSVAGEALLLRSRGMILFGILLCVGFNVFIRLYEEPALQRRYGEEYVHYRANVRRWLPRLTPYDSTVH